MGNISNNQIASILIIVLGIMLFVLLSLICIFLYIRFKTNKTEKGKSEEKPSNKTKVQQLYSLQSIFNFMEFDKIEDNMIVQKKRKKICNGYQMSRYKL